MKYSSLLVVAVILSLSVTANLDAQSQSALIDGAKKEGKVVFLLVDAKSPGITVTQHIGFFV